MTGLAQKKKKVGKPRPKGIEHLLSRAEVLSLIPISYPTMWALMRKGEFPRSRQVGKHKRCWLALKSPTGSPIAHW